MPLPMPRLDNRTFDQLLDEGRLLLPRLTPAWTDHNVHDPGITLIELLAWLVETDLYRLDRITPAAYRTFLRLIGIEPYPPQVAETVLVFQVKSGIKPIKVPQGTRIENENSQIKFQTKRNLTVSPAHLVAVLAGSEAAFSDCYKQNEAAGKRFAPFGTDPQPGHALYLGFDHALSNKPSPVSLYVWANSPESDADLKRRLMEECKTARAALKTCERHSPRQRMNSLQHYSARTQWEYYDKPGTWLPLARVVDETRGLTLNGAVRFIAPVQNNHAQGRFKSYPDSYFFIRCRLLSGYYECPPQIYRIVLNAVTAHHAVAEAVEKLGESDGRAGQMYYVKHAPVVPGTTHVFVEVDGKNEEWCEARDWDLVGPFDRAYMLSPETGQIIFGDGLHGHIPKAGATISARYQEAEEELGESNCRAGQVFLLKHAPVVPGTTHVFVEVDGKNEEWREARDWDLVGPFDRAYMLSPETGQIVFGDGLHGRVPNAEVTVRPESSVENRSAVFQTADKMSALPLALQTTISVQYRRGGGVAGNVSVGTLTKCPEISGVEMTQPFAASGGAAAESLVEAMGRAIAWLADIRRAITLTDFEQIAQKTPGVPVARAHALADYHPALPGLPALGSVTVVVVPQCANPVPEPGPDMLSAIKKDLDRRRLLTSEIYVIGPKFITVAVQARLHVNPEVNTRQLTTQAQESLEAFFHPLHGGPDGKGWPIGRDVYRAEIMARLNAIAGVAYVDAVTIKVEAELSTFAGNVSFKRMIHPGETAIVVRGRLLIAPTALANRVVAQACGELERYIRTQRGWLKHKPHEVKRAEAMAVFNSIPDVLRVDEVCLNDQSSAGGLCENLTVCQTSLVISGQHQITVVPAQEKSRLYDNL